MRLLRMTELTNNWDCGLVLNKKPELNSKEPNKQGEEYNE
jgi:hypothetical protein